MIVRFIDENKDRYGVEPMCAQLAELGCAFAPSSGLPVSAGHRKWFQLSD